MARSALRTIALTVWTLAMLSFSQRAVQARLVRNEVLPTLRDGLMDPRQWEPAGDLLSRVFAGTDIAWVAGVGDVWTLPGMEASRDLVEHRGQHCPNHQQYTARTTRSWESFHLQLDFRFDEDFVGRPLGLEEFGNSGIYVYGLYEVQLLDTSRFLPPGPVPQHVLRDGIVEVMLDGRRMAAPANRCLCGSIYGGGSQADPLAGTTTDGSGWPYNFCNPSGQWNRLDVYFTPPRYEGGRKTQLATIAVAINGQQVFYGGTDRYGIPHPTGSQSHKPDRTSGPIVIQDHGSRVSFRNIRIDPAWKAQPGWALAAR